LLDLIDFASKACLDTLSHGYTQSTLNSPSYLRSCGAFGLHFVLGS